MNQPSYEQIIVAGIRRLSPERLREVADFVYFLRQRDENDAELQQLIGADLSKLDESEIKHLEEEFEDYERLYPPRK
jgi:hypothetical protein